MEPPPKQMQSLHQVPRRSMHPLLTGQARRKPFLHIMQEELS
jgi:hypothetical protein